MMFLCVAYLPLPLYKVDAFFNYVSCLFVSFSSLYLSNADFVCSFYIFWLGSGETTFIFAFRIYLIV